MRRSRIAAASAVEANPNEIDVLMNKNGIDDLMNKNEIDDLLRHLNGQLETTRLICA